MSYFVNLLKIDSLIFVLRFDLSIHDQMSCLVKDLLTLFSIKILSAVN